MDLRRINDRFAVAPQLFPQELGALRDLGFALVINNRPDGEEPGQPSAAEMAAAAEAVGIAYREIPVAGGFQREQVQQMAHALADAKGPVFAYCRSGTRSTLLWALARASQGADPDSLAAAAASAGYDIAPVRPAVDLLAAPDA